MNSDLEIKNMDGYNPELDDDKVSDDKDDKVNDDKKYKLPNMQELSMLALKQKELFNKKQKELFDKKQKEIQTSHEKRVEFYKNVLIYYINNNCYKIIKGDVYVDANSFEKEFKEKNIYYDYFDKADQFKNDWDIIIKWFETIPNNEIYFIKYEYDYLYGKKTGKMRVLIGLKQNEKKSCLIM